MTDDPIRAAIVQLKRLPGVGEKTATRFVYWLLRKPEIATAMARALSELEERVVECQHCCNLTTSNPCRLCSIQRDDDILCVVEEPQDVLAFERSGEYRGRYHVLHGALSPLDGVTPDRLRIRPLLDRLRGETIREVILATNPTVEGDTTALYLGRLLEDTGIRVTRLAHGLSVGTEIEYANAISISRALKDRRELREGKS